MDELSAVPCTTDAFYLGEGCRWDEVRGELSWVSVHDGAFMRARADGPAVEVLRRYDLGGAVGVAIPYEDRDAGWVVARDRGLVHLSVEGAVTPLVEPEAGRPHVRLNDGAADPWGRVWVGSMAHDSARGQGRLFRWHRDLGLEVVLEGLAISNGLGWSPDRRTMYFVDSLDASLDVLDVGPDGDATSRRPLVAFAEGEGLPDGLCVDAQGCVWVALWYGGAVARVSPEGDVLAKVRLPVSQPSSCAIGGASGTTLYVTTAQEDLSAAQLADEPLAGRLFCCDVGVAGVPIATVR